MNKDVAWADLFPASFAWDITNRVAHSEDLLAKARVTKKKEDYMAVAEANRETWKLLQPKFEEWSKIEHTLDCTGK